MADSKMGRPGLMIAGLLCLAEWSHWPHSLLGRRMLVSSNELWTTFNNNLAATARASTFKIAAVMQKADPNAALQPDFNFQLANKLQIELTLDNPVPLGISTLAWESSLPELYDNLLVKQSLGIKTYDQCLTPGPSTAPQPADASTGRPCGEGGFVYFIVESRRFGPTRRKKRVAIFYTPLTAWGPALVPVDATNSLSVATMVASLEKAKVACSQHLEITFRIHLDHFVQCLASAFDTFIGFTPIRGLVVAPEAPPDPDYMKPGYSSPPGHVIVLEIKAKPLLDRITVVTDLKFWIVCNAPVLLQ